MSSAGGDGAATSSAAATAPEPQEKTWAVLRCPVCKAPAGLRCGRCKGAFYCSAAHQKAHFGTHKRLCTKEAAVCPKACEALLDVAAPLFVFGRTFDSTAVCVDSVTPELVDGRPVLVCVTGRNRGRPVTAAEFCASRPDLFYVAHSCSRGLAFALTFALAAADVAASKTPADGRDVVLTYEGEPVAAVGVVERAPVQNSNFPAVVFVDAETGPYASTASAASDHGLAFLRMASGRVVLVDFAASQFGCHDLHNDAPLLVCDRGSARAKEVYGPSEDGWVWVEGTAQLGDALKRYLATTDTPERGNPQLGLQIRKGVQQLVSILRTTFDIVA